MEAIVEERERGGLFSSLKDFCQRLSGKEVNKRTIENFIKAGAFDSFGGTRKQFMMIYVQVMDTVNQEKKSSMTGQMSLFDIMGEEDKKSFEIRLPDVGEYAKESKLAFEKRGAWCVYQRPSVGRVCRCLEKEYHGSYLGLLSDGRERSAKGERRSESNRRRHDHRKNDQIYEKQ